MRRSSAFLIVMGSSVVASNASGQGQPPAPPTEQQPPPNLPPPAAAPPAPGPRQPYPYPYPYQYYPPPGPQPGQPYPQQPQPYPYPYQSPPGQGASVPPPLPPRVDPTANKHDGFFFQLAPGLTIPMVKVSGFGPVITGRSTGPALSLAFGGTITTGLVLAGAIDFQSASMRFSRDGTDLAKDTSVRSTLTGVTVAYYPNPLKGLFVQGGAGFATMTIEGLVVQNAPGPSGSGRQYAEAADYDGFGVFAAVGHEWFFADQWSVGVMGRVDGTWTSSTSNIDLSGRWIAPSLRMTLTQH